MGHHHHHPHKDNNNKITAAGLLITLGIIFGDIGTSPLYVLKAIVGKDAIDPSMIYGAISCIFWTLTLQTTVKYVFITLNADNKGEGGIFSLYALVRRRRKWLIFPAIIGGAALLADGIITPPISVASAIEGLRDINPHIKTIPIIISILVALFTIQQFGTKFVGKFFGPIMLIWFFMLGTLGFYSLFHHVEILKAVNPHYAYKLLVEYPGGFWLLGAVFLCTTGAEALYSDLGHCGKGNIRVTWIFVKIALLLNYFGQGAWLVSHGGEKLDGRSPFFTIMPDAFLPIGITIATMAAIVASQALISGSFTLINEAVRLNFGPKLKIIYPTNQRGQLYIPMVNWVLMVGCITVVLIFRESSNMEAAYGLSIVITMLMTTTLLCYFLFIKRVNFILIALCFLVFYFIEIAFLIANLSKFTHGGWLTLIIGTLLFSVMFVWFEARKIKNKFTEFIQIKEYLPLLTELSADTTIPKYATHLVYMTSANNEMELEEKIIYSIFRRQPKRADIYWFVHVDVLDEPYTKEYKVEHLLNEDVIKVNFRLGFRIEPKINIMFRKVVEDLVKNKEVDITSRYESLNKNNVIGDFSFVVLEKFLSNENELTLREKIVMKSYIIIKELGLSEEKAFGLDTGSVTVEKVPMIVAPSRDIRLTRVFD